MFKKYFYLWVIFVLLWQNIKQRLLRLLVLDFYFHGDVRLQGISKNGIETLAVSILECSLFMSVYWNVVCLDKNTGI